MAVSAQWYGLPIRDQWQASPVNWAADNIKVSLHTSAYNPLQDTDEFWSAALNELPNAGGYLTGGVVLGGKSVQYDPTTNEIRFIGNPVVWNNATFTCRKAVVYKSTGTPSTSPLMGWVDFGQDMSVVNGTFTITWDATGVLKGIAL